MGRRLCVSFCLFLIFWFFSEGCADSCTQVAYSQYTLNPHAEVFNGTNTFGSPACLTPPGQTETICSPSGFLGDGPPTSLDLNVSAVHAWDDDVDIVFATIATTRVRQVNLYFHHDPSQRIGLPFVELFWSDTAPLVPENYLRYTIVGNQDLSENDMRLRNVSLVVITPENEQLEHRFFRVHFEFNTTVPVDWVLLSEVQLCSDSVAFQLEEISFEEGVTEMMIEAGNFTTTSVDLSCTVSNDGYFQWEWTFPSSSVQPQMQLSEASRTSTAQISNNGSPLSIAFEGEYTCRASYRVSNDLAAPSPAERTITLQFERELEPVEGAVTASESDPTATLGCELSGYVTSDKITWAISGEILENNTMFTITTEEGSRLVKVGDDPPRPSIRSILTIHELTFQPTPYIYICSSPDFMVPMVISLTVESEDESPEPLELGFINDSPDVQGNNISASIQFSRPVDTLRCSLTGIPYQDCASGSVTFINVPPREDDRPYILRVEGETTDGVRTVIARLVRIEQPNICTVQLINDGVTVDGNSATIQFSSRGPAVEFLCSLDRQPLQPCSMTQTFPGLSVGDHRVKIVPEGCGRNRRPLVVRFTVEEVGLE